MQNPFFGKCSIFSPPAIVGVLDFKCRIRLLRVKNYRYKLQNRLHIQIADTNYRYTPCKNNRSKLQIQTTESTTHPNHRYKLQIQPTCTNRRSKLKSHPQYTPHRPTIHPTAALPGLLAGRPIYRCPTAVLPGLLAGHPIYPTADVQDLLADGPIYPTAGFPGLPAGCPHTRLLNSQVC